MHPPCLPVVPLLAAVPLWSVRLSYWSSSWVVRCEEVERSLFAWLSMSPHLIDCQYCPNVVVGSVILLRWDCDGRLKMLLLSGEVEVVLAGWEIACCWNRGMPLTVAQC